MNNALKVTALSVVAAAWVTVAHANGNGQECDHLTPCSPTGGDTTTVINNNPTAVSDAHALGVGHVETDVRNTTDVDVHNRTDVRTGVVTNVQGDRTHIEGDTLSTGDVTTGDVTQTGGTQNVNVEGDRHNTRVGAITGAPTVYGPSNLSKCSSGWALSVGGGNPFTGSGGIGFSYTSPSGAPVLVSAHEFLNMELSERQDVVAQAGLTDTELSRLQCALNETYARDQAHAHRLAEFGVRTLIEDGEAWKEAAGYRIIAVEHDGFKEGLQETFGAKRRLMQQGNSNPTAAQMLEESIMNLD